MNISKFLSDLRAGSEPTKGKLRLKSTDEVVADDIEYTLVQSGLDHASGTIRIDDDPQPASAFMRNDVTYILETSNGSRVEIFFTRSTGEFTCVMADQAADALKRNRE